MVAAYALRLDIIYIPSTPARVDESVDEVVTAVTHTETPEMAATRTPVQFAAPMDTPQSTEMSSLPAHTAVPKHTPRPKSTTTPTRTPRPPYTPNPTTTTPPTPTQIPGRANLYKPIHPPNHMAGFGWYWRDNGRGFDSIDFDFTLHNDIDVADIPVGNGLYLMLDNSSISETAYYFGLQVGDFGRATIFSRWGTRDLENMRVPDDGYYESAGYEGDFISVRKAYRWGKGDYSVRIAADGDDNEGRWFGLWITDKTTGETTWCGSLRFPFKAGKATLNGIDHGGVVEVFGGTPIKPIDIPEWHITMKMPVADGSNQPIQAHISYTNYDGLPGAPNTSIEYDSKESSMHVYVGATTQRTTEEGWINLE